MSVNLPDLYKLERRFEKQIEDKKMFFEHVSIDMFLQMWPSDACGFDEKGEHSGPTCSEEYTTVFIHTHKKTPYSYSDVVFAGVFFGEKLAYTISNPNETFLEDLKERDIACVGDAEERYQLKESAVNIIHKKQTTFHK